MLHLFASLLVSGAHLSYPESFSSRITESLPISYDARKRFYLSELLEDTLSFVIVRPLRISLANDGIGFLHVAPT